MPRCLAPPPDDYRYYVLRVRQLAICLEPKSVSESTGMGQEEETDLEVGRYESMLEKNGGSCGGFMVAELALSSYELSLCLVLC